MSRSITTLAAWFLAVPLFVHPAVSQEAAPAAAPSVKIELLEQGSEPRKELRFHPEQGATQSVRMAMDMTQKMKFQGNELPAPGLPTTTFQIEVSVDDVASNGDITFRFEYTDLDIQADPQNPLGPTIAASMKTLLQPMIGTKGKGVVTDRGITKKNEMETPENLNAQLKTMLDSMTDSMNQLSSPVPQEPIGIGAKWKVTQDVSSNGIQLDQIAVYELKSLQDDQIGISVSITQDAEPQTFTPPGAPAGTTVKLLSLDTTGSGESVLSLSQLMPVSSTSNVESKTKMEITIGAETQAMETENTIALRVSKAEPVKE